MKVQDHTDNVIIIDLRPEPDMTEELEAVIKTARRRVDQNVIVDFTNVGIMASSSISRLLQLRKIVRGNGRSLVLLNVTPLTRGVFSAVGLDDLFEFRDDPTGAAAIQRKEGLAD